jgi:hypothetical protein
MNRPVGIRIPLAQLGAQFKRRVVIDGQVSIATVETLAEADGIWFRCPKCQHAQKGVAGVHHVLCWFEGRVADDVTPGPGRWTPAGSGLVDLTFVPTEARRATSVLLTGGCRWHGHIVGGHATLVPV